MGEKKYLYFNAEEYTPIYGITLARRRVREEKEKNPDARIHPLEMFNYVTCQGMSMLAVGICLEAVLR